MAHIQHQQASGTFALQRPNSTLKVQPVPHKRHAPARHGSLQPQENDDGDCTETGQSDLDAAVDSEKVRLDKPHRLQDCPAEKTASLSNDDGLHSKRRATTLLPELELLCKLTRRIAVTHQRAQWTQQELEANEDQDNSDDASLSSLYCQRAKVLLQYAKFDASVYIPLPLLESLDPDLVQRHGSSLSISSNGWWAVKQAQDDALAAIASDQHAEDAYYVAAQSARSLGHPQTAIESAERALRQTPQSKKLHTLVRQLHCETDTSRFAIAPPLLCRSQQQQQEGDEGEEELSADVTSRYQSIETLSTSPMLHKLESMLHESIHHQCASQADALALAKATSDTVAFLSLLLNDTATTTHAIQLETHELLDMAKQLTDAKRLHNSPPLRRWLVKTLAPAVVQSLSNGGAGETVASGGIACRAAVLRDVLLTLARLMLATGSLQRCTNVSQALATTKLAYDLTTTLAVRGGAFRRLEMACKDAYALALLDLAEEGGEALVLHQETLDLAVQFQDRDRELVSRHLIGRALVRMREGDAAQVEFARLLQQSEAVGESRMVCLALYALGECQIAEGDLSEAMRFFTQALVVCNESAHGQGTWRRASLQHAIDFYGCLQRPTRRRPVNAKSTAPTPRKATLVVDPPTLVEQDSAYWAMEDEQEDQGKKVYGEECTSRRGAVWMTASLELEDTSATCTPRRTLAETLIGGYTGEELSESKMMRVETEEAIIEYEEEKKEETAEEPASPLTTFGVTLMSWLIDQSAVRPTWPACCKPVE